ncbi:MAG: hypothetical protein VKJ06_09545 [Vampirovibrionales bacterium]|nr:hypothetical protein [Vampirovibrionales bacterium]
MIGLTSFGSRANKSRPWNNPTIQALQKGNKPASSEGNVPGRSPSDDLITRKNAVRGNAFYGALKTGH